MTSSHSEGKVQSYPDAYFAAKVGSSPAVALQTHPRTPGLKGVSELSYSGSYPVSRLSTAAADMGGVQADLYVQTQGETHLAPPAENLLEGTAGVASPRSERGRSNAPASARVR